MKILFLTNLLPYPLDNGGKIKTYTTLKSLSEAGHDIDLYCFKEVENSIIKNESEVLKLCHKVKQVYLPLTTADHKKYMIGVAIKSIFSTLPFSIYKYQSKELIRDLSEEKCIEYDVVYFDHLPMCWYLKNAQTFWPGAKMILDEHNCEATISSRKAKETSNFAKKVFLKLESFKLEKFESKAIGSVDKTIVLSKEDYISLKKMCRRPFNYSIIPIGVPDHGIKVDKQHDCLNILFIGTLTWEPNNAGLIWFLKKVMPLLVSKIIDFHLYIVGKNPSKEVCELSEQYKKNVTVTGYVDSVDYYYDICDCTIVPLFVGSGQRVKLIEAFSKGIPAISTTIGAEGLHYEKNESILIADSANEFCDAFIKIRDDFLRRKIGKNSRKIYEEYYSFESVSEKIVNAIGEESDEQSHK